MTRWIHSEGRNGDETVEGVSIGFLSRCSFTGASEAERLQREPANSYSCGRACLDRDGRSWAGNPWHPFRLLGQARNDFGCPRLEDGDSGRDWQCWLLQFHRGRFA